MSDSLDGQKLLLHTKLSVNYFEGLVTPSFVRSFFPSFAPSFLPSFSYMYVTCVWACMYVNVCLCIYTYAAGKQQLDMKVLKPILLTTPNFTPKVQLDSRLHPSQLNGSFGSNVSSHDPLASGDSWPPNAGRRSSRRQRISPFLGTGKTSDTVPTRGWRSRTEGPSKWHSALYRDIGMYRCAYTYTYTFIYLYIHRTCICLSVYTYVSRDDRALVQDVEASGRGAG